MNAYLKRLSANQWTPQCRWQVVFNSLAPEYYQTHYEAAKREYKFYKETGERVKLIYLGSDCPRY